jgi:hypothetical protein
MSCGIFISQGYLHKKQSKCYWEKNSKLLSGIVKNIIFNSWMDNKKKFMDNKRTKLKFFAFFIFGIIFQYTQAQNFSLSSISTSDGLSSNRINCIIQDETRFMWFGTNNGLDRYDGYGVKHFSFDTLEGLEHIVNTPIISITGNDNFLFIATAGKGIFKLRPQ